MKKGLTCICSILLALSVCLAVISTSVENGLQADVSYAFIERHYNDADDMNTTTTPNPVEDFLGDKVETTASGGLLDSLGNIGGGFDLGIGAGDIFSDAGDVIGSVIGGIGGGTTTVSSASGNNVVYIDPVPAGTDSYFSNSGSLVTTQSVITNSVVTTTGASETVNANATKNPFTKPSETINPGDSGDAVKWMQWIFIYTNYGLTGKSITGVYDADTVEVVKKLQKEEGLTEDGIVNDAVIDKIELLYYEYTLTLTTASATVAPTIETAPETLAQGSVKNGEEKSSLGIIIAVIAAIWCIAIVLIIILFILKKKKAVKKAEAEKDLEFTYAAKKTDGASDGSSSMSLSDLFEEANNKD